MADLPQSMLGSALSSDAAGQVVVRLRLIGQMEAWSLTSENVLPQGRKTRALLAVVALSAPRPALRGRLAELLWSRRPEEQARASLRQEIHRLLEALSLTGGDILTVTRDHLSLRPGAVWVDVDEVMRATVEQPASLSLLDGDLLEDLDGIDPTFDAWLAAERERVRDKARSVAEALLRSQVEPEAAIPVAQRLLSIDRAHEGAWRALMRAHAARGERGMAIQAYDRCRSVLADLLDAAPSAETQKLLAEIRGPSSSRLRPRPPAPLPIEDADEPLPVQERKTAPAPTRGGAHVGVLPLQLVGTSEDEAHLATGLAEEITTALARFRWMFVVSSNSLARFAIESRDETAIRRTFGIDFLLDGTIQKERTRLRITLRLLDLRAGNQIVWARRFDRQSHDLLSLQDEIASEVVAQIDPEILLIEANRIAARPPIDATAYDLMLRAVTLIGRMDHQPFMQAGELLERAIVLEPDYAAAHAWYAYWHVFLVGQGWAEGSQAALEHAGQLAERAIVLDPVDARGLAIAGHVRAFLHHRLRDAISLHERALSLNPNLAMAWNLSGVAYAYLGDWEEAERRVTRYKKLSPLDPHAFFFDTAFIIVALLKRDYESAVVAGRAVTEMNPAFSAACKPYLAALGHAGRLQEASVVLRRLLVIESDFTVERFLATTPIERPGNREHFAEGLRRAGVPENDKDIAAFLVAEVSHLAT
ncbi:MAG TPA: BTAD domain-containing putative transcriptional regulator [Acetobacteraceae bacterium]|jgi:DNA-binding SARP family transcriptional activator/TolB-like protein|nr:BTAD domain-containing putative transcriptional regulator [Acetobacteraceae bacterium]